MKIVLGTRGSALALAQTEIVARSLRERGLQVEMKKIKSEGDLRKETLLENIPQKGIFTKALQESLKAFEIDAAIHSVKDLPVDEDPKLSLFAVLPREDPRDAFVSFQLKTFQEARSHHVIGTGSPRRRLFLQALNPAPQLQPIRGNVDTRIRKCEEGKVAGIVVAVAGLKRLGKEKLIRQIFSKEALVPAPGQGAIGIEIRKEDEERLSFLKSLEDKSARFCVALERKLLRLFGGGCHLPFGCLCWPEEEGFRILARWQKGEKVETFEKTFSPEEKEEIAKSFLQKLSEN